VELVVIKVNIELLLHTCLNYDQVWYIIFHKFIIKSCIEISSNRYDLQRSAVMLNFFVAC
jgi:hypothetical protein